jgi:ribonuclease HI
MRIFYTDGSYGANSKDAGGWSFLEIGDDGIIFEKWDADFSVDNTSNRMELKAAIEALKLIKPGENATIYSDSQYVVKGISEWIKGWLKNGWVTARDEPIKHKDLWLEMLEQVKDKNLKWVWVRAHAFDEFNNRADEIARLSYIAPEEIQTAQTEKRKEYVKPEIGSMIYFDNESKRYMVMLNDVKFGNAYGFLAKLFANHLGNELEFFDYNSKITLVENKSDKESRIVFKAVETFKDNVKKSYDLMKKSCKHKIERKEDYVYCSSCGRDFGWYCPKSKDKCCHYFSDKGKIKLRNGEVIDIPKDHEPMNENYDECIFCHHPEERK